MIRRISEDLEERTYQAKLEEVRLIAEYKFLDELEDLVRNHKESADKFFS
jgi:hypothetical protein